MVIVIVAVIYAIVYVQQGRRYVPVMYPGRRVGSRMSMPVKGTLPLMVKPGWHDPASSSQVPSLLVPAIIAQLLCQFLHAAIAKFATSTQQIFSNWRGHLLSAVFRDGRKLYFLLYGRKCSPAKIMVRISEESRRADPGPLIRGAPPKIT